MRNLGSILFIFYCIMPNECGEGPGEKYYQQLTDLIWSLVHYRAAVDLSQFITDMHQTCGERRAESDLQIHYHMFKLNLLPVIHNNTLYRHSSMIF